MRLRDWINSVGNGHGARLKLSAIRRLCKLVRPWKQPSGIEEKLLPLRNTVSSMERLASEGKAPESALPWRESDVNWESELRSEGSVPVSDREAMSIAVTWRAPLGLLHLTPLHSQKSFADHPDGVGVRDSASFDMNGPSSAMAVLRRLKQKKTLETERRNLNFIGSDAILNMDAVCRYVL